MALPGPGGNGPGEAMAKNAADSPPPGGPPEARIAVGDLVVDRDRFRVTVADDPAPLTYMEFEALHVIAEARGRVVAYDRIAEALWGGADDDYRARLAVLVSRIRSKLGPAAQHLENVRQVGYRLSTAPA
ncbi:MAG: winged helix-turn-helix transcriptional regulator [Chloroflexi bacterium]|nr:winged helix-turn-helix transcriptional regulator [Chloroflexota bacterium]